MIETTVYWHDGLGEIVIAKTWLPHLRERDNFSLQDANGQWHSFIVLRSDIRAGQNKLTQKVWCREEKCTQ